MRLRSSEKGEAEANALTETSWKKLRVLLPVLRPKNVCNDSAGIAENPALINKMMINWS